MWVRPLGEEPTDLFALLRSDISPPVTIRFGTPKPAPTVQLTAYLRGQPSPGWLRVHSTSTQIGRQVFEQDHTVVDARDELVVQSRQLELSPRLPQ